MTVKSDEFAQEIINMRSDVWEYGFNKLPLVCLSLPSGSEYGGPDDSGESDYCRKVYKTTEKQEKIIKNIEGRILEQGMVLREQRKKIEVINSDMKKQKEEFRDIKLREKKIRERIDALSTAALFRDELYMEQLRSGEI